jgi:hypothetical protein
MVRDCLYPDRPCVLGGSNDPVIQVELPPRFQLSPDQVSLPGPARNRIGALKVLAVLRIPTVDEIAGAVFSTRIPVIKLRHRQQRPDCLRIALPETDYLLPPQLPAGGGFKGHHVCIESGTEDLRLVEGGTTII